LPAIEAMVCGCIPIICNDNLATQEFVPSEFVCDPNPLSYLNKICQLNKDYEYYQKIALEYGDKYKKQFSGKSIASNIISVYNSLL
jgi:glycosyltransferase involved in cell wall biosynthesis